MASEPSRTERAPRVVAEPVQEFFSIGDVCALTELKPHVLRYWEEEFGVLRPHPAGTESGHVPEDAFDEVSVLLASGGLVEDGRCHLARHEPLPDQVVEAEQIAAVALILASPL